MTMTANLRRACCERAGDTVSCCATRRSALTSIRSCRPSSATGATSSARGARRAVLFDQSHHMAEITIKGPDALQAVLATRRSTASQFCRARRSRWCPTSYDGYVIGDGILFYLDKDELLFVGRAPTVNWLQFHAQTGGFKVEVDPRRSLAVAPERQRGHASALPLSDPGTERAAGAAEAERRTAARNQVLQLRHDQHQGAQGARAAPRHGG